MKQIVQSQETRNAVSNTELEVSTTGIATATRFFPLATDFSCFSLKYLQKLVTKSENTGTSWPQNFFPESQAGIDFQEETD